ncbi:MAG TPA: hypothetical protein DDW53_20320 [Lachnoclostridium sp.]|nr:hypothetical protein [Lachnoclostridium sp.]
MEKFYIVTPSCQIHKEYLDYKAMSEKVNDAFVEFAKEQGFETHEYYQSVKYLHICPTDGDTNKFGKYFKKDAPGLFKKNSQLAKAWVNKCQGLGLKSPHKPNLGFEFRVFGRTSSRLFMINDVLYASFRADCDFKNLAGLKELKASEFFKVIEEYEESLEK